MSKANELNDALLWLAERDGLIGFDDETEVVIVSLPHVVGYDGTGCAEDICDGDVVSALLAAINAAKNRLLMN